ncbi:MAG: PIN domain-containing protein [Romboutsia sp.]
MRRIFLVDTENVNLKALTGAHLLNEEDMIVLFVTNRTDNYSFSKNKVDIINSKAIVKRIKVLTGGKNSLDFQLVSYLGLLIGYDGDKEKNNYYIVSNDHGFYSSINLLTNCSDHNLELIPNIDSVLDGVYDSSQIIHLRNLEDEVIVELKSNGYTDKTAQKAIIAIKISMSEDDIEDNFFNIFGWNNRIFSICKPIIDEFYKKVA